MITDIFNSTIIKTSQLLQLKQSNQKITIVDVSNEKDSFGDFKKSHLENSIIVSLNDNLVDPSIDILDGGRHPLPEISIFIKYLESIGINESTPVVIYDRKNGANAAARFWWMLKAVGLRQIFVLDGGFQEAERLGYPMSKEITIAKETKFQVKVEKWLLPLVTIDDVANASKSGDYIIVDVREESRYSGEQEPIDAIAGHIPSAINIPFKGNLDKNGYILSPQQLLNHYSPHLKDTSSERIIFHCGSGVTACYSLLAMHVAGYDIPNLFVGSWSQWSRSGGRIEVGFE